jgi:hypothetical protein
MPSDDSMFKMESSNSNDDVMIYSADEDTASEMF